MEPETRQVVRNVVREAVAVLWVLTALALFVARAVDIPGLTVSLSEIEATFLNTWVFIFIGAGGFLVFGKKAVSDAVEVYNMIRGEGGT